MPDQAELRVNVISSGKAELDAITASMKQLDDIQRSAGSSMAQKAAAEAQLTALLERRNAVLKEVGAAEKSLAEQHEVLHSATTKVSEAFKSFGESIHERITEPLGYSYFSVGKLAEAFGPLGVAAISSVGVLAGLGTAAFESAKKLGELGTEINNISIRTGLSTEQVGLFGFAAKAAGADIQSFETAMRMLSRGLAENSEEGKKSKEALRGVGIETHNLATGEARSMADIFLQLSDAMNAMTNTADRNTLAVNSLGRAGIDLVPTLLDLRKNLELAQKAGIEVFSQKETDELRKYHEQVLLIEDAWDKIWHAIEHAIVAKAAFVVSPQEKPGGFLSNQVPERTGAGRSGFLLEAPLDIHAPAPGLPPGLTPEDQRAAQLTRIRGLITSEITAAGSSPEALKKRVKDAEEAEAKAAAAIELLNNTGKFTDKKGNTRTASDADVDTAKATLEAATAERVRAQAAEQAVKDAAEALKRQASFLDSMAEKGANPVEQLYIKLDALLKEPGRTRQMNAEARVATSNAAMVELTALQNKGIDEQAKFTDITPEQKLSNAGVVPGPFGTLIPTGQRPTNFQPPPGSDILKMITTGGKLGLEPMTAQMAELKRFDEDAVRTAKEMAAAGQEIANIQAQSARENLVRESSRAGQVAQLQIPLGAGTQGQEKAINDAYAIRLDLAEKIRDVDLVRADQELTAVKQRVEREKANADYLKESQDAQLDKEMKLLALSKEREQQGRTISGSVFDAIVSKNPGEAVRGVFLDQAKDAGRSVFSNLTTSLFEPLAGMMDRIKAVGSKPAPEIAGTGPRGQVQLSDLPLNSRGLARSVALGAPGALGPAESVVAIDTNTAALRSLTAALLQSTMALRPSLPALGSPTDSSASENRAPFDPSDPLINFLLHRVPHFADGGVVDKPTMALIGEAGPEAVIPLRNFGDAPDLQKILKNAFSGPGDVNKLPALAGPDLSPWEKLSLVLPAMNPLVGAASFADAYARSATETNPRYQEGLKQYGAPLMGAISPATGELTAPAIGEQVRNALVNSRAALYHSTRAENVSEILQSGRINPSFYGDPALNGVSMSRVPTIATKTPSAVFKLDPVAVGGTRSVTDGPAWLKTVGRRDNPDKIRMNSEFEFEERTQGGPVRADAVKELMLSKDARGSGHLRAQQMDEAAALAEKLGIKVTWRSRKEMDLDRVQKDDIRNVLNFASRDIPKFADGGVVTSPTVGMIGEAGPERIMPLKDDPLSKAITTQTAAILDLTDAMTYIATGGAAGTVKGDSSGGSIGIAGLALRAAPLSLGNDINLGTSGNFGSDVSTDTGAAPEEVSAAATARAPGGIMGLASKAATSMSSAVKTFSDGLSKVGAGFGVGGASVASGQGISALTGTGHFGGVQYDNTGAPVTGANATVDTSVATQVGAGVGLAGATYAGVTSALHDFNKGGAQGITQGIGDIAGTAAAFDPEPISHAVLEGVALASKVVGAIFGDPKAERQSAINKELTNNAYNSTGYIDQKGNYVPGAQARSISYFGASTGASFDTNFQGGFRTGSFADTTRNMYDPSAAANQLRNGSLAPPPGYSFDNAIGYGNRAPGATGPLPQTRPQSPAGPAAPPTPVVVHVTAMDSKSFLDHAADISAAVRKGVQMGHPLVQELAQTLNPR